jgi:hypothetical protein
VLQGSIPGTECILYPLNVLAVYRHDVESHDFVGVSAPSGKEKGCGANELALLVNVDGRAGAREVFVCAIAHLDEDKAVAVPHDEVDLTQPAAEVSQNRFQAFALQVIKRDAFRVET